MNSGELSLNTRRKVSFAAAAAGGFAERSAARVPAFKLWECPGAGHPNPASAKTREENTKTRVARKTGLGAVVFIACLDARDADRRFTPIAPAHARSTHPSRRLRRRN